MAGINTRLNIKKLDGNIVQKHGGSKQVGFKQLGPGVKTGVHGVHDEKRVWFEVELQGAQGDRKAEEKEYETGWKIKMGNILDSCNQRSTQQCMKIGVAKHLGVAGIQQQNGLVDETNVTLFDKVLHGFEFEVEPLGDHKIELARDREQHLACELFGYREDSIEVAFAVAAVEKIYAYESLTFNDTVACEVISKWKARLKEDMDVRLDVYVLSNGCRKSNDDSHNYYWSMHQGHSTLLLKDSLSGGCDVEKNGKRSYIYAVGSQKYQVVCTRLDITSADVGMLDKFDHGLQKNIQVFVDFDYAMGRSITVMSRSITRYGLMILGCARSLNANLQHMEALSTIKAGYMTFTEAWKKKIWLKGLLTESGYELRLVAGIATGALVKGCSRSEVPAQVKVDAYRY
ncbi:hypothetical protein Tco_1056928 [Tanacetum coccineum]|uniref:Zinc finger, CCHC-type n=1 Tax=Tanacetum coccineum TaxID=301880 RepID=A0ABQ5H4X9_9ASTR